MNHFNLYSHYYDLLYHDKNYGGEVEYVLNQFTKLKGNHILELGCGSGGHAEILCGMGNQVVGLDLSEGMIQLAIQKQIEDFDPRVGNIINFDLDVKFDCVISMFHVISYLTNNNDLFSCFSSVNRHLNKDGLFVFDFWYGPAVLEQKPESRIKEMENNMIYVNRKARPTLDRRNNIVNVEFKIEVTDKASGHSEVIQELHPMRYFFIPELEFIGEQSGFKLIKAEELMTCNAPSESTWGVCVTFKKI